jgi:2-amino-4-hydroxy-6-hydroxymethyldihydropteridine diphosphokinase
MPVDYFLSLGSNIRPEENIVQAVDLLQAYGTLVAASEVYQTPALGAEDQPDYLNAAVLLRSALTPEVFQSEAIPSVEHALKRVRSEDKFAARTIDVDIMLAGLFVGRLGQRDIPSQEIVERPFVAIPLAEIAPDFMHPVLGLTLAEIARRFDPSEMTPRPDVRLGPAP